MSLPALPSYAVTDAINAVSTFAPVFRGQSVPVGTMIHAQIIVESYVNENFIVDPAGASAAAGQAAQAGGYRFVPNHNASHAMISAMQADANQATAFNWLQLLLDIISFVTREFGSISPPAAMATP